MRKFKLYDNGGETADRYTCVFLDRHFKKENRGVAIYEALGFNECPYHPQGIGMHTSASCGRHLGKQITLDDLPPDARRFVESELTEH